ncbi:MAG: hypothetical protein IT292_06580 [Deltaproteobacteria bacterium]|nr:hypothetical protein [Deltaproteobacteria bacterium]
MGKQFYEGTSIPPSVSGSYDFSDIGSFNGYVWSHFSAEGGGDAANFTEIDYDVNWSVDIDDLTLTGGSPWFTYSDKNDDFESEADYYFRAGYAMLLNPTLEYRKGMDTMERDYIELKLSEQVGCDEKARFTLYIKLGFTTAPDYYYESKGLVNLSIGTTFDNLTWEG